MADTDDPVFCIVFDPNPQKGSNKPTKVFQKSQLFCVSRCVWWTAKSRKGDEMNLDEAGESPDR